MVDERKGLTYKDSGVDVEAGYEAVKLMKKHIAKTITKGVVSDIGGFGGLFSIDKDKYDEPVLVSGTDGVGTKLKVAFMADKHNTIGEDCVAMCVNDILCQGAKPLFFLDYIATGKLKPEKTAHIVEGIANGCVKSEAALIGGETAEMPGLYSDGEYDVAGFAVGIVDKSKIINGRSIKAGDVLVGLSSSGIHSNGYSLVRKLLFDINDYKIDDYIEELGNTIGEVLLTPTKIYVKSVLPVLDEVNVKGLVHVTGGGFYENVPRALPEGLGVEVDSNSWNTPSIFKFLQKIGNIEEKEMFNTFNMGIGMIMVVNEEDAEKTISLLKQNDEEAFVIGKVTDNEGVIIK